MSDDLEEVTRLIRLSKSLRNWSGFQKRSNHAGSLIGSAQLVDESGTFLQGLTIEIELKAPIVTNRCLFLFTVMQRQRLATRKRIYQLEVCPADKRSHNGLTTLYGPHEHLAEDEPYEVAQERVNCDDWDGCLQWFFQRINLQHFDIEKPC